ncbi:PAS domain S-box/diguanylate cyclase (GGDEF) domain-containing protein (fragment) [Candidatus Desulfosporosinus infrequens]|uniref:PAS domain S-box/diguanylate cyclase (GGDEF) domain-containing protein n=1 Tax=Candidatus Desulfosporosinus infrequens TaxID=2043169 RepID=A0A2U3LLZ9_9FIRM
MYKNKTLESEGIRLNTIRTLMATLHKKYLGSEQHSKRVSKLCQDLGRAIGLSEMEVCGVRTAGFFHDIGYVSIEEDILNKPGKLVAQEWDEIKRHAEIGYRILSSSHEMSEIADYVLAHHERWDGKGYPRGVQGKLIPIEARIVALASSYVAMTSERPYRSALQEEVALQEIIKNAGTQFDPRIVQAFVKHLNNLWQIRRGDGKLLDRSTIKS